MSFKRKTRYLTIARLHRFLGFAADVIQWNVPSTFFRLEGHFASQWLPPPLPCMSELLQIVKITYEQTWIMVWKNLQV
jgi:hypothetical protein